MSSDITNNFSIDLVNFMCSSPLNLFILNKTSKREMPHVAGLELRNEKEDIITMSDLSQKIIVILPLEREATHGVS